MHERCETCGLVYQRGPGYFLGSIYFNYGVTAILVTAVYLGLWFSESLEPERVLWLCVAVSVLLPLAFFPFARSLWVGFDHWADPIVPDR
jgi:hypothetical protein